MLHVSTQKLIIKLCELTAQGDIQWREGKDGAAVFETEGYAVEVGGQPARLRVLNLDGNELERVESDSLTAAPWPNGDGTFADRVSTMAAQAQRLARGTDHAISRILSSLSAPPAAASTPDVLPEIEALHDSASSADGGAESDACMAAAVADMATGQDQAPREDSTTASAAAIAEAQPQEPETVAAPPEPLAPPVEPEPPARAAPPAAEHIKRSTEVFGGTRSFAVAGRTHHRQSQEARPISSLGKITASGLLLTGTPTRQPPEAPPIEAAPEPEAERITAPAVAEVEAPVVTTRPIPAPASPDAYKPWV